MLYDERIRSPLWTARFAGLFPEKKEMKVLTLIITAFFFITGPCLAQKWPPTLDMPYPDLKLVNQDGEITQLSQFKGKVIVVEPIGMTCPACNAFVDSKGAGGFQGNGQQKGLPSLKKLMSDYAGISWPNRDVVVVYLLLYNQSMKPPTLKDAKAWAKHFDLNTWDNEYVLVGKKQHQVYELVPGFQLIDKDFRLVSDSTGHNPKNDTYRHTFPMLGRLVK
jgi:hypothetical protein